MKLLSKAFAKGDEGSVKVVPEEGEQAMHGSMGYMHAWFQVHGRAGP